MKENNPILLYIVKNGMLDELIDYAAFMWSINFFSLFNSAVLMVQRPGVGFAAGENTWQKKYNRLIKPDARPLVIVRNFAPLDIYYEASDTYSPTGEPLPEWMDVKSPRSRNYIGELMKDFPLSRFDYVLNQHGIYFGSRDFGSRLHGEVIYDEQAVAIPYVSDKGTHTTLLTHYSIIVNSRLSDNEKKLAVFHEIGHLLCGHLTIDEAICKNDKLKCRIPKRNTAEMSFAQKEYEAELTCRFIVKALGFDYTPDNAFKGIDTDNPPPFDLGCVTAAADLFLSWFEGVAFPRQGFSLTLY